MYVIKVIKKYIEKCRYWCRIILVKNRGMTEFLKYYFVIFNVMNWDNNY